MKQYSHGMQDQAPQVKIERPTSSLAPDGEEAAEGN